MDPQASINLTLDHAGAPPTAGSADTPPAPGYAGTPLMAGSADIPPAPGPVRTAAQEAAVAAIERAYAIAEEFTVGIAAGTRTAAELPSLPSGLEFHVDRVRRGDRAKTEVHVWTTIEFSGLLEAAGWRWTARKKNIALKPPGIRELLRAGEYAWAKDILAEYPPSAHDLAKYVGILLGPDAEELPKGLPTAKWLVRLFGRQFTAADYAICKGGPHQLSVLTHWRAYHGDRAACRWLIRKMRVPLAQIANVERTWFDNAEFADTDGASLAWGLVQAGRYGMLRYLHRTAGEPLTCEHIGRRERLIGDALRGSGPRAAALVDRHTTEWSRGDAEGGYLAILGALRGAQLDGGAPERLSAPEGLAAAENACARA